MTYSTQTDQIRSYLKSGRTLTAIEALELFRCFRLAARIQDLKAEGMTIATEMVESSGKRFARYHWSPPVRVGEQMVMELAHD